MAKKARIPKKVAGLKVPKGIRKSPVLTGLMRSKIGRELLAKALTAGAAAAAAVLIEERKPLASAAKKGVSRGGKAVQLAGHALESGASAAVEVLRDAASSALPKRIRKAAKKDPRRRGARHGALEKSRWPNATVTRLSPALGLKG
ncbi:hypothetical protein IB238_04000 [Rhizobium sp. ARZ01]|uniref:hypothetical protein n=1 Tax=Rhizobium sp. ARZ01 TaxID=2769313 RepID=UPI00177C85D7|nr:hypothetical protein [Rhizobium sp. ARZ01]MBD9371803.1 hypothetical protein [Rhizobium sp. ARZ01]